MAAPSRSPTAGHWLEAAEVAQELAARDEARQARWRGLLLSLLDIADAFDRLGSEPDPGVPPAPPQAGQMRATCLLIGRQFAAVLARAGVVPIQCVGTLADPHQHVIVETRATAASRPGTILEEIVRGYLLDGQPLRQPHVIVSQSAREAPS